ncbi:MAG: Tex-like N-terminal domain-containing protein, partial [Planctomycetota bacterium]
MNAPECSDRTPADADAAAEPAADAACAEKASADEAGVEKPSAEKPGGDTPPQVGAPLEPAADGAATNAPPPAPPAGKPAAGPAEEIARRLKLDRAAVAAAIDLLDAGASPLFIARYRPDEVGGLSKADAQAVRDRLREARRLDERRASILRSLAGQTKLTDARRAEFERADSLHRLEDLHLPLKPRKPSPGAEAVRQGLLPLAEDVLAQSPAAADLDARLADFVDQDRGVPDAATALAGAGQILAERFSEDATLRGAARAIVRQTGRLRCRRREGVADKKAEPHKNCFDLDQPLRSAPAHRVMAINRGERAGVLQVSVESDAEAAIERGAQLLVEASHTHAGFLRGCVE